MVKDFQEYPEQPNEQEVHTRQSDGELLSDEPSEDYLYTHVLERIRKASPTNVKSIVNPLVQAERSSFVNKGVPDTGKLKRLRKRLQRDGFQTVNHPDWPSFFEVKWK
jgi:hypothetical protein